jgi:hypothetical protein
MERLPARVVRIAVFVALLAIAGIAAVSTASPVSARDRVSSREVAFRNEMRRLWEDHVTWTRLYIVSAVAGLPDAGPTAERLLQNQVDIGNAIKPYYGEAAGDQLTALLREHILIAADLVAAAKAGDNAAFEAAHERWYANADEIAVFLSSANPHHWPLEPTKAMMREHLDLTLQEAGARLAGDWSADIAAYDQIHLQALHMADMLSDGIVSQFPKAFK